MQEKKIRVKIINEGNAEGELLVYPNPISFLGEVDPKKGVLLGADKKEFEIKGKILIFPNTRGSTVGSYVIYALKYYNNAPSAIIVVKAEPILITGAILAGIPLAEGIDPKDIEEALKFRKARLNSESETLILIP